MARPHLTMLSVQRKNVSVELDPVLACCRYMGWQAHVTVDPWTGLSLHDVNFLGDRIAYEISVQDQFVAYSGYSSIG